MHMIDLRNLLKLKVPDTRMTFSMCCFGLGRYTLTMACQDLFLST